MRFLNEPGRRLAAICYRVAVKITSSLSATSQTSGSNRQHLVKTLQPSNQQDCVKGPHSVPSADCGVTIPRQDTQHNTNLQNQEEGVSDTNPVPNPGDSGACSLLVHRV